MSVWEGGDKKLTSDDLDRIANLLADRVARTYHTDVLTQYQQFTQQFAQQGAELQTLRHQLAQVLAENATLKAHIKTLSAFVTTTSGYPRVTPEIVAPAPPPVPTYEVVVGG